MRIAIIGTRGIPANYGGFETFAEELSTRLVPRAASGSALPGRASRIPSHVSPQILRDPGARVRLDPALAGASRGLGALLQWRQCDLHALPADLRHAGGAQRGRHRTQA